MGSSISRSGRTPYTFRLKDSYRITVTERDYDLALGMVGGIRVDSCPVALALKRTTELSRVSIGSADCILLLHFLYTAKHPKRVQEFIRHFDFVTDGKAEGKPKLPFRFEIVRLS